MTLIKRKTKIKKSIINIIIVIIIIIKHVKTSE